MAQAPGRRGGGSRIRAAGERAVTGWCTRYTRAVDPLSALDRSTQVDFELWEFGIAAERRQWSDLRIGVALLARTVAGAPRDLEWRRTTLRGELLDAPVRLVASRHRPRVWVPLQQGHVFDQTNGMIEGEFPRPDTAPLPRRPHPARRHRRPM